MIKLESKDMDGTWGGLRTYLSLPKLYLKKLTEKVFLFIDEQENEGQDMQMR